VSRRDEQGWTEIAFDIGDEKTIAALAADHANML